MRCVCAQGGGGRELSRDPGSKTPTQAEARVTRAPYPLPHVGTVASSKEWAGGQGLHRYLPGSPRAGVNRVPGIIR